MKYVKLGKTNITVSKLCFGGLTVGPLQADLSPEHAGEIISRGFEMGINFIDTAELYETYSHIKHALKRVEKDIVISTKTYAYTKEMAKDSLEKARKELDRDYIDIFMLHEQESVHTLRGHKEAIEYFLECKEKGIIKAFGISTHHIEGVRAASITNEIDIIHPIVNYKGLGIVDGNIDEMLIELRKAYDNGKGIFAMKPLGGGNLIKNSQRALDFVNFLPFIHSIALGMQSIEEVEANIAYFNDDINYKDSFNDLRNKERRLHIDSWCEGCKKCIMSCSQEALSFIDGTIVVDESKCILCGYCGAKCPVFAIKVI